jgi:apolipoprotein N-acyltransferase
MPRRPLLAAFLAGALAVAGFAPLYLFPLPVLTLALLLQLCTRAPGAWHAGRLGFAFGLGLFLTGVSWVYVSLHDFGAMPAPLAAFATLLFCAFLALFPAAACVVYARSKASPTLAALCALPAAWCLLEWVRGWIFTGFPWLTLGYSQAPWSPLAGYAPLLGVYGISLLMAISAGLLWLIYVQRARTARRAENPIAPPAAETGFVLPSAASIVLIIAIWLGGFLLQQKQWTQPAGEPVSVSLLQGNIAQDVKWRPEQVESTLRTYMQMTLSTSSGLIIMPETAVPLFYRDVPKAYLEVLTAHAKQHAGDILIGMPERIGADQYYNSVLSFGSAPTQIYRKSHLVPFGEFIPLKRWLGWIVAVLSIPLSDFARGAPDQQPLNVAGQRVAVNICYEDSFGEEITRQLPQATILANVSNVAWFGDSLAPMQHLQISQMRAIETGRYMLRATNTGMTAIVDTRGRVEQVAPEFTRTIVTGRVPGYQGSTPFMRWGDTLALAAAALLALPALWRRRR